MRAGISTACLALVTVSGASTGQIARADLPGVVLVALDDPAAVAGWTTVNDPVMGGRSTSTVGFGDGGLVFSGTISLENNGGFASARSPADPGIGSRATGAGSLGVRARGDGKTYLLKVETAGLPWSYIQRFATEAGVPRTYELPVGGFQPVGFRLDPAPEAPQTLDPSNISRVSIYILDKQQGPFQITVSAIVASP
ncbi:MAG: CIA30 family protein [Mycobacterium sp.]